MGSVFIQGEFMGAIEQVYYESLPFIYALFAIIGLSYHETSKIPVVAAFALGFCSYYIFRKRYQYRHGQRVYRRQAR